MGNDLSEKEIEALRAIRNHMFHVGRFPPLRVIMSELKYSSPRSASLVIERLIDKNVLKRKNNGDFQLLEYMNESLSHAMTINIPLVGTVSCGTPIFAEQNIEAMIPVSVKLAKEPHKYFVLRAKGDSMNLGNINDGDMVLVRQQSTANNGDVVVALVNDMATVKEFRKSPTSVILMPRSSNRLHQPIVLTSDFTIQGVVITCIPMINE